MRILTNGFPTNLPVSETLSQGGPANFARLFTHYIHASGADHPWIGILLEGVHAETADLEKAYISPRRRYYRLRLPKAMISGILRAQKPVDPLVAWADPIALLVSFIQEQKPDVIFLNGFGILHWMLLQAAQKTDVPVVIQHAGIWTKELFIHKNRYSKIGRNIMEQMEKDSSRLATVEIFLNAWSKEYYRKHVAEGDEARTKIVPLPFDFTSFNELSTSGSSSAFHFDKHTFHIGVIARWDEIKNHKAVLALAKGAQEQGLPWQFHAVVDIPEDFAKEKIAYERYVDILPPLDRADISDFCRSVDLLLLPSLFDVSPTVVLEATALNTPIVISKNIGYVTDFKKYGAGAWVIDPEHPDKALRAIGKVMGKKMPLALRNRLIRAHDHNRVFAQYLRIFKSAKRTRPSIAQSFRAWIRGVFR